MKILTSATIGIAILGGSYFVLAQQGQPVHAAPSTTMCQKMVAEQDNYQEFVMEADRTIETLVTIMEESSSANKAKATASVASELVVQRKMLRSMKKDLESKMMMHMMHHMESKKMMECPAVSGKPILGG